MENIKKNKILKLENKISSNKTLTKQKEKTINCLKQTTNKNKFKPEEKKVQTPTYENNKNSYYNIKEENEKANIKAPYNFTDLNNIGSRMNQLKHREPDESIQMLMPKENNNKLKKPILSINTYLPFIRKFHDFSKTKKPTSKTHL